MKWFDITEFDSPDQPGSGNNMRPDFLIKLDLARGAANIPFVINSGFRTIKHNEAVGGSENSPHLRGYAADIKAKDSQSRFKILRALVDVGFTRIGIAKTFIHADNDPSLAQNVLWMY